jgi:hypothetical protein
MAEFKTTHHDIAGLQESSESFKLAIPGSEQSIIEDAKELTDIIFSEGEQVCFSELVRTTQEVHEDLERGDSKAALAKLKSYLTNGMLAGAQTEAEVYDILGDQPSGAYEINMEDIAQKHVALFNIFQSLNGLDKKGKTTTGYSTMYRQ